MKEREEKMKNGKDKDRSIRYIFFYIILFVIEVIWGCVALKTGLLHKSSKIFLFCSSYFTLLYQLYCF